MAYVIKNGKTNLQQEAHIHQPTHAHSHFTRAVAAMDSCIALIEAHHMTKPSGQWTGETRVSKTRLLQRRVKSTPWSVSSTPRPWIGVCVPLALIKFVLIKNNSDSGEGSFLIPVEGDCPLCYCTFLWCDWLKYQNQTQEMSDLNSDSPHWAEALRG